MKFKEYIPLAKRTITYDSVEKLIFCSMAGMMGELTEYIEHVSEKSDRNLITAELGDICWYTAILADHFALPLDAQIAPARYNLQAHGYRTIGQIQEILKKVARDNEWVPTQAQKDKLTVLFSILLYGLQMECRVYQLDFSDILEKNIAKLSDRAERGVLKGEGDTR